MAQNILTIPAELCDMTLKRLNRPFYPRCSTGVKVAPGAHGLQPQHLEPQAMYISPDLRQVRLVCQELKKRVDAIETSVRHQAGDPSVLEYTIKEIPEFKAGEVLPRSNWPLLPDDDGPILMPPPANLQSIRTLIMSLCPLPARSGLLDMGSSAAFHHTAPKLPQLRSITFARRLLVSVTGADFERKCSREGEAGLRIRCYMRFKGNADSTAYNLANSPGSQSVSQATAMQLFLTDYQVSFEETYLSEESGERLRVVYNASENVIESKIRYPGSMAL